MSIIEGNARLGNQIFRSIACSMFAEKFNLSIQYRYYNDLKNLGIELFIGSDIHEDTKQLTDNNYFNYLEMKEINFNIKVSGWTGYFQTKKITDKTFTYLHSEKIMNKIIEKNKHKGRYNNNDDCFIHIRLGDVAKYNQGIEYYNSIISKLSFTNLYIATDSPNHPIILNLKKKYPDLKLYNTTLTDIMLFGSTCKYIILSYGTFSAIIGYLAYFSEVYCLKFCEKIAWDWNARDECDVFRDKKSKICDWTEVEV